MFFESWTSLLRVLLSGLLSYCALIVLLRVSGKRTLSKMNAFDLVVTVALGSTLATILLDNSIPIVNGLFALGLLILLQYAITWAAVRSHTVHSLVKSDPTVLLLNGRYLEGAMREQRVTRDEIEAALRDHGSATASNIACVVLETDGSLSVVPSSNQEKETTRDLGEPPSTPGQTAEGQRN